MRGFFTGFAVAIAFIIIIGFIALMLYPDLIIIYNEINKFFGG